MRICRVAVDDDLYFGLIEGEAVVLLAGHPFGELAPEGRVLPLADVRLVAPVMPTKVIAVGRNYVDHAKELGNEVPVAPMIFLKPSSSIVGPGVPIRLPWQSEQVEHEAELAIIIGRVASEVPEERVREVVLGYTCANDVSARDWQIKWGGGQFCQGKSFDTFCPLGPVLVTKDEIPNPNALRIRTILNGETLQDWNTDDMIFDVPAIIAYLSSSKTLVPGTVILTGTPHGVGFARNPPVWLKSGDSVTIDIEKIGALTNPVVNEKV